MRVKLFEEFLKRFDESLIGDKADDKLRMVGNIKDIFVAYQDSHDLDVYVETNETTVRNSIFPVDNVLMVTLFEQRGIRFDNISDEIGMLIEYIKSLTDKEVKIYYDLDRSGVRNWRPLADSGNEFDDYLQGNSMSFNTIKLYFVECVGKTKLFEAGFDNWQGRRPIEDDIDTCLVELGDVGFKWLTTDWSINKHVMVTIEKDFSYLDEDTRKDYYHKGLHKFNVSDIYESVMLLNDWMFEKYGASVTYKIYRGNSFKDSNVLVFSRTNELNVDDKDSVTEILIKYNWE